MKDRSKLAAVAGFVYGSILAFYAVAWGVDGPTLALPLAASPLNVPAAILDKVSTQVISVPEEVMWLTSIILAPFGWLALALSASRALGSRRRIVISGILVAHYVGIGISFALIGEEYLLRPFRVLTFEGASLLTFYAVGQGVIWWELFYHRKADLPLVPGEPANRISGI